MYRVVAVFLLALALRAVHLWFDIRSPFAGFVMGDARAYDDWAIRLAAGEWRGNGVFYQSPLYAHMRGAWYAILGHDLAVIRGLQTVLGAVGCALAAWGASVWFDRKVGLATGVLLALSPTSIYFDALLQKSVLDTVLAGAFVLALGRAVTHPTARRAAWLGAVVAIWALNRENALIFVPLTAGWFAWRRPAGSWRPALALMAAATLVLGTVTIRNAVAGGHWHVTTAQLGPNLFIGNGSAADGTYVALVRGHGNAADEQRDATALAEQAAGHPVSPRDVSQYWIQRTLRDVADAPGHWARIMVRKAFLFVNARELADTEDIYSHAEYSPVLWATLQLLPFGVILPLALVGVWIERRSWRQWGMLGATAVLYGGSVIVFFVLDRYRYPVSLLIAPFAAVTLVRFPAWWRLASLRSRGTVSAVVVLAAVVSWWPLVDVSAQQAVTAFNVGVEWDERGRPDEAAREYERAVSLWPALATARTNLGVLDAARGHQKEAREQFEAALQLDPALGAAHSGLGTLLASVGQTGEALGHLRQAVELEPTNAAFRYNLGTALATVDPAASIDAFVEATRLDPGHAEAHNNLGILLASTGRLDEAVRHFTTASALRPDRAEFVANLRRARSMLSGDGPAAGAPVNTF